MDEMGAGTQEIGAPGGRKAMRVSALGLLAFLCVVTVAAPEVAAAPRDGRIRCVPAAAGTSSPRGCRRPPPPPPIESGRRGSLTIRTSPPARLSIDGVPVGHTPLLARHVDAGRHRLVLRASCGTTRRAVRVPPGQHIVLSLALCPSSRAPRP